MQNILNYLMEFQRYNYTELIQPLLFFPLKGVQFPLCGVQTGFPCFHLQKDRLWTNKNPVVFKYVRQQGSVLELLIQRGSSIEKNAFFKNVL